MNSPNPKFQSSAKEFTLILLCAVTLSFAFVQWFKTPGTSTAVGGLKVGSPAPTLLAEAWVHGEAPDPAELEGEVYVVIAWATWCLPCFQEAPHLVELQEELESEGVRFFGLTGAPLENEEAILEWLDETKIPWPNGFGREAILTLTEYQAEYIPAMWVIGRDGTVWWNRDDTDRESLEQAIRRALREPVPAKETQTAQTPSTAGA